MTSYKSIKTDVINVGAKWEDSEVVADNGVITSRKAHATKRCVTLASAYGTEKGPGEIPGAL